MDAGGATHWTGDRRLRLCDIPFRGATFRCAFTLSFASGSQLLHSNKALGSFLRADRWRRCLFLSQTFSRERSPIRTSGSIAGLSRMDCVCAERNSRRRDPGAVYRDSDHVVCRGARAAVVAATRVIHCWNRGDGWARSSPAKFVSFPGDLDIAALDSRYRPGIANTVSASQLQRPASCAGSCTN